MKKKYLNIQVDEPCHESWEKMTPLNRGRFCGACEKEVVDFTQFSDQQIVAFLKNKKLGTVCGRFQTQQLGRSLPLHYPSNNPLITRAIGIAIAGLLSTGAVRGQSLSLDRPAQQKELVIQDQIEQQSKFSGKIIDKETGEAVVFANILVFHNETLIQGAESDFNGDFSLLLPSDIPANELEVQVSQIEYVTTQIDLPQNAL
ncbi:MAG: hypothetical protein KDC44_05990, partial [Phaeodactylibacter sp.]|nr:hypothetical protein [Phaeodactylibacter sp.]